MEHRQFALQKVSNVMGISEVVDFVSAEWGCSRRTSLRDIELAQSELAHALNSVELQQMVCWMARHINA